MRSEVAPSVSQKANLHGGQLFFSVGQANQEVVHPLSKWPPTCHFCNGIQKATAIPEGILYHGTFGKVQSPPWYQPLEASIPSRGIGAKIVIYEADPEDATSSSAMTLESPYILRYGVAAKRPNTTYEKLPPRLTSEQRDDETSDHEKSCCSHEQEKSYVHFLSFRGYMMPSFGRSFATVRSWRIRHFCLLGWSGAKRLGARMFPPSR